MEIKGSPLKRSCKRYHSSWLLALASIGLLVGTFLSQYTLLFVGVEWLVVTVCLVFVGFINRTIIGAVLFITAGVFVGLHQGAEELLKQAPLQAYVGEIAIITGRVAEDPSYDVDGDMRLRLVNVIVENKEAGGEVWVSISEKADIIRSDVVTVEGRMSEGFGNIAVAMYRTRLLGVQRQDYADVARDTRDWFAEGIREGIKEPEASLGAGFLLGQKTAMPEKLDNELRLLGLTHIVVASGYNLSILVRFGRRFFAKLSRFAGLALSGFMVFGFANITGFSPSMSRAALITGLSLLAWYYGRKFHPVVLLSVSAGVTVFINPAYAWGDIGWLLSFTSFIGVIMLSPLIHAYFWGDKKPGNIRQVFIETLSAQLLTLPLIAFVFGQYSPLALIANILILPLIPLAMLLTFIAGIVGVFVPVIASYAGWPAQALMSYMTTVVDWLAQRPLASVEIIFTMTTLILGYLAIFIFMVFLKRRTKYDFRQYNIVE